MTSEQLLGKVLPLLVEVSKQLMGGLWGRVVFTHQATNPILDILNWIEIGTTDWPVHALNPLSLKKVPDDTCSVHRGVIVLQDGRRSNTAQQGESYGT